MHFWKVILFCCMVLPVAAGSQTTDSALANYEIRVREYIQQFKDLAIEEQKRTGVPASIKLAQGIHETSAGLSELCTQANNHFGIKCKKEWTGETFAHTDDLPNECFRKYIHFKESYRDHSDYLKGNPRYANLFKLSMTDYSGWCTGLKKCGYATNPRYAQTLIRLIEDYKLQDYTLAALQSEQNPVKAAEQGSKVPPTEQPAIQTSPNIEIIPYKDAPIPQSQTANGRKNAPVRVNYDTTTVPTIKGNGLLNKKTATTSENPIPGAVVTINDLKAFYALKGATLHEDALKFKLDYATLLQYNDLPDAPLEADMYIYLEKKLPKGAKNLHVVKPGETLLQIAQSEGVQLKYIKFYNRLATNEEPVAGALIRLQGMTDEKPEVYIKTDPRQLRSAIDENSDNAPSIKKLSQPAQNNAPASNALNEVLIRTNTVSDVLATQRVTRREADSNVLIDEQITRSEANSAPDKLHEGRNETNNLSGQDIADAQVPVSKVNAAPAKKPKDKYDLLKEQLDKVVYANKNQPKTETDVSTNTSQKKEEPNAISATGKSEKYYIVKKGDTAFSIAKQHQITVRQLREWNHIDFEAIKEGIKLRVR